ncbi:hypothetical protein K438DRAFT_1924911 [Mycena galopus ATCC 62051]|nr:hypothetical protein K438DRAFT_1924911 [Mycena galopus ATCC 62051]
MVAGSSPKIPLATEAASRALVEGTTLRQLSTEAGEGEADSGELSFYTANSVAGPGNWRSCCPREKLTAGAQEGTIGAENGLCDVTERAIEVIEHFGGEAGSVKPGRNSLEFSQRVILFSGIGSGIECGSFVKEAEEALKLWAPGGLVHTSARDQNRNDPANKPWLKWCGMECQIHSAGRRDRLGTKGESVPSWNRMPTQTPNPVLTPGPVEVIPWDDQVHGLSRGSHDYFWLNAGYNSAECATPLKTLHRRFCVKSQWGLQRSPSGPSFRTLGFREIRHNRAPPSGSAPPTEGNRSLQCQVPKKHGEFGRDGEGCAIISGRAVTFKVWTLGKGSSPRWITAVISDK